MYNHLIAITLGWHWPGLPNQIRSMAPMVQGFFLIAIMKVISRRRISPTNSVTFLQTDERRLEKRKLYKSQSQQRLILPHFLPLKLTKSNHSCHVLLRNMQLLKNSLKIMIWGNSLFTTSWFHHKKWFKIYERLSSLKHLTFQLSYVRE